MSDQASLAAFEAFAAAERGRAVKYTTALVGAEAAQDIVQDGLVVVWKKWETLTNPAAYLHRTCRLLAFAEYETRNRGPALLAELPEQPRLGDSQDDDGQAEIAAVVTLLDEVMGQNWSSPLTLTVAAGLALGDTRAELAEYLGTPLSEVHRSARELRRYYKARRDNPEPATKEAAYTPHGLVMKAMRRLTRREREVMALAAIGLQPQLIAPLIGITGGSARTTLCHARKAVAAALGLCTDNGMEMPKHIDLFIQTTLDKTELLGMLPNFPWKPKALRWAAAPEKQLYGWSAILDDPTDFEPPYFLVGNRKRRQVRYFGSAVGLVPYLTELSTVIAVARDGLECGLAVAYGSVRWLPFGVRIRAASAGESLVYAAAYRRLQETDNPDAWSDNGALATEENVTVGAPGPACPVPSWPARTPRYLVPAAYRREPQIPLGPFESLNPLYTIGVPTEMSYSGSRSASMKTIPDSRARSRMTFTQAA